MSMDNEISVVLPLLNLIGVANWSNVQLPFEEFGFKNMRGYSVVLKKKEQLMQEVAGCTHSAPQFWVFLDGDLHHRCLTYSNLLTLKIDFWAFSKRSSNSQRL